VPFLFELARLADIDVSSQIAMAPLTRRRAGTGRTANTVRRRARRRRHGIYSPEPDCCLEVGSRAVHAQGGKLVLQLWHVGRLSYVVAALGHGAAVFVRTSALVPARGASPDRG
jgi:N-ethylmaleimide reductase